MKCVGVFLLCLASANGMRNVDMPLGECYDCEVTCFEDCALKFDREIIKPDNEFLQLAAEPANRSHAFSWRTAKPGQKEENAQFIERGNAFAACLQEEKCAGHPVNGSPNPSGACAKKRSASLLESAAAADKKCRVSDTACSEKCASKVVAPVDAKAGAKKTGLLQKSLDVPLHPVKIGVFSKGQLNLDQCLKSCLTATCGCDGAPGFNNIKDIHAQVVKNKAAGEPVKDTEAVWQYRAATLAECAKGVFGQKITAGLFVNYGSNAGWMEVCTDQMVAATFGTTDTGPHLDKCKSTSQDDVNHGCTWNNEKSECVFGAQPIAKCFHQYKDDKRPSVGGLDAMKN